MPTLGPLKKSFNNPIAKINIFEKDMANIIGVLYFDNNNKLKLVTEYSDIEITNTNNLSSKLLIEAIKVVLKD